MAFRSSPQQPHLDAFGGEVFHTGQIARTVFNGWMNSPGHREILVGPGTNAIGLARRANHWVGKVLRCPTGTEFGDQCLLSGDLGNSSLAMLGGGGSVLPAWQVRFDRQRRNARAGNARLWI